MLPARPSTIASAARASSRSSSIVAAAMTRALSRVKIPEWQAARVPGKLVSNAAASARASAASTDDTASAALISRPTNSPH